MTENLIEAFQRLGLTRQQAEIAAAGATTNPLNHGATGQRSFGVDVSDALQPMK